jgi:PPOX class probable F420-dependent enzyme
MLNPDVRRHLEGTPVAHLATVLPDGSPHTVPLWVDTRGDQVVFLTGPGSRKARNLRRDPRVALSLTAADNPFEPIVIRGRVVEWLDGARPGRSSTGSRPSTSAAPTPVTRSGWWPSSSRSGRPSASAERSSRSDHRR